MAKIPLYNSQERLSVNAPQDVRESPQAAGQFGRDLQGVGEAVTQAHDTIRQAYDFQQIGSAKLKTLEGVNAITARAEADGDNTGDLSKYESDFQSLKSDTLKGITNPAVKAKFALDFDLQAAQTKTQITTLFRKNMVNKGLANLSTLNEYFVGEYAKTGDPSYIDDMGKNIDTYVTQGFIGADDGQKLKTAAELKAKESAFVFDKENNPALAKEKLSKNAYGFDVEKLAKANEVFDREVNKMQKDNADKVVMADINGEPLSIDELKIQVNKGMLDPTFAKARIKEIEKGDEVVTDEKVYEKLLIDIQQRNMTATEIYTEIYNNSNKLSKSDRRHLLYVEKGSMGISTVIEDYTEERISNSGEDKKVNRPKQNYWGTVLNMAKTASVSSTSPTSLILGNIIQRVKSENAQGEKMIDISRDEIRKQRIRDNPEIANLSVNGYLHEDKYGNKAMVYPDGTYEEVQSKSGEFVHKEARKKK